MRALKEFAVFVAMSGTREEWLADLAATAALMVFFTGLIIGLPLLYAAIGIATH